MLGLTEILKPLRSRKRKKDSAVQAGDVEKATAVVLSFLKERQALGSVSSFLAEEVQAALELEKDGGAEHLNQCVLFLKNYLEKSLVPHTAIFSTEMAMEILRRDGLKAIKKWRAWQAFKKADRLDLLCTFLYAKPNSGSLQLELPDLVPDDPISGETITFVQRECTARILEALNDVEFLNDLSQEEKEFIAIKAIAELWMITNESQEQFLVKLAKCMNYLLFRITHITMAEKANCKLPSELVGSLEDFEKWKREEQAKERALAAEDRLEDAGRLPVPELNPLRTENLKCPVCNSQTVLEEHHLRSSDEPSSWIRICPSCAWFSMSGG